MQILNLVNLWTTGMKTLLLAQLSDCALRNEKRKQKNYLEDKQIQHEIDDLLAIKKNKPKAFIEICLPTMKNSQKIWMCIVFKE